MKFKLNKSLAADDLNPKSTLSDLGGKYLLLFVFFGLLLDHFLVFESLGIINLVKVLTSFIAIGVILNSRGKMVRSLDFELVLFMLLGLVFIGSVGNVLGEGGSLAGFVIWTIKVPVFFVICYFSMALYPSNVLALKKFVVISAFAFSLQIIAGTLITYLEIQIPVYQTALGRLNDVRVFNPFVGFMPETGKARAAGFFSESNYAAQYIMTGIFISNDGSRSRFLGLIIFIAILMTGSVSSLAALVFGFLIVLIRTDRYKVALYLVGLLVPLIVWIYETAFVNDSSFESLLFGNREGSINDKLASIQWALANSGLIFGNGFVNFSEVGQDFVSRGINLAGGIASTLYLFGVSGLVILTSVVVWTVFGIRRPAKIRWPFNQIETDGVVFGLFIASSFHNPYLERLFLVFYSLHLSKYASKCLDDKRLQ